MNLYNYVDLYYIQWCKIKNQQFKTATMCMKNMKNNLQKYTNTLCRALLRIFIFVERCDLCLLTSFSVLHTTSREIKNLCYIRNKIEIIKLCWLRKKIEFVKLHISFSLGDWTTSDMQKKVEFWAGLNE